ncbi:hypothetical protein GEMRC1_011611 [Eukaryota sp. GEM-RC1]
MVGLLKRKLSDPDRDHPMNILIFDEIHNRDLEGDICLTLCKYLLSLDPTVRIVLMSATLPSDGFEKFFSGVDSGKFFNIHQKLNFYSIDPSNSLTHVSIPDRRFPIKRYFFDDIPRAPAVSIKPMRRPNDRAFIPSEISNFIPRIIELLVNGLFASDLQHPNHDQSNRRSRNVQGILVFLSALNRIIEVKEVLEKLKCSSKLQIYLFHSTLPSDVNDKALLPLSKRSRKKKKVKIILATNIAESSMTIPDINIVIDTCTQKETWYDSSSKVDTLIETYASRQLLDQREGRIGRVGPELFSIAYLRESVPMTLRSSFTRLLLQSLNISNIRPDELLAALPSPPDLSKLNSGYAELESEGIIKRESDRYQLTSLGRILIKLPLSIPAAKLAFYSCVLGFDEYGIIAACLCDRKSPIKTPLTNPALACKSLLKFSGGTRSDVVAGINSYIFWRKNDRGSVFLSLFSLNDLHDTILQTKLELSSFGLTVPPFRKDYIRNHAVDCEDDNDARQSDDDSDGEIEDEAVNFLGLSIGDVDVSSLIETSVSGDLNTSADSRDVTGYC